jgi:hypothetical protein
LPATLPVHESVDEPGKPMLAGFRVQRRFVELLVTVSITVLENPPSKERSLIVEVPGTPTVGETLVGVAERAKSWTVTANVVE